jgi:hypothetical protein
MRLALKATSGKTGKEDGSFRMKRFLPLVAVGTLIGFTLAFAAEKPGAAPPLRARVPEMRAAGKVMEVSDALLKIERMLNGKPEVMEFLLEKPLPNVAVGDQIKVSYQETKRNIVIRVAPTRKTAVRKTVGKELPKGMKPVAPPATPVKK